jgi:hypothetical protein
MMESFLLKIVVISTVVPAVRPGLASEKLSEAVTLQ